MNKNQNSNNIPSINLPTCLICCESTEYFAVPESCLHQEVCIKCILKYVYILKKHSCPFCSESNAFYSIVHHSVRNPPEFLKNKKAKDYWIADIRFTDDTSYDLALDLVGWFCPKGCEGDPKLEGEFKDLKALEDHLWNSHKLQYCSLCVSKNDLFIAEQVLYTTKELNNHFESIVGKNSKNENKTSIENTIISHPKCKLCNKRFFDNEEISKHCLTDHQQCQFCSYNDQLKYRFYKNVADLTRHYDQCHQLCHYERCKDNLKVFKDECELQIHILDAHKHELSKEQLKNCQNAVFYSMNTNDKAKTSSSSVYDNLSCDFGRFFEPNKYANKNTSNGNDRDKEYLEYYLCFEVKQVKTILFKLIKALENLFTELHHIEKYDRQLGFSSESQDLTLCRMILEHKLQSQLSQVMLLKYLSTLLPDLDILDQFKHVIFGFVEDSHFDLKPAVLNLMNLENPRTFALIINYIRLALTIDNPTEISNYLAAKNKSSMDYEKDNKNGKNGKNSKYTKSDFKNDEDSESGNEDSEFMLGQGMSKNTSKPKSKRLNKAEEMEIDENIIKEDNNKVLNSRWNRNRSNIKQEEQQPILEPIIEIEQGNQPAQKGVWPKKVVKGSYLKSAKERNKTKLVDKSGNDFYIQLGFK